jgi:hypothetical protein
MAINGHATSDTTVDPCTRLPTDTTLGVGIGSQNNLEADFDDWIGFILPDSSVVANGDNNGNELWRNGGVGFRINPGPDWTHGHHVVAVYPDAAHADHSANWAGNFRGLQQFAAGTQLDDILTSSTASAQAIFTTKAAAQATRDGALGVQGIQVNLMGRRAVGGNGSLAWQAYRLGPGQPASAVLDVAVPTDPSLPEAQRTAIRAGIQSRGRFAPFLVRRRGAQDVVYTWTGSALQAGGT